MPKLTDKQLEAVLHEQGNILVSASAGSGKTHTMIERVKRLILEKNIDVSEILCVTFTEKAALEMKEKLKKALSDNCEGQNKQRILSMLAQLPTADISTLHSFCVRLIRSYFFVVGVSPDFKVIDGAESNFIRNECIDKTFREFYESEQDWFYTLVDRYAQARSDAKLKEIVLSAYAFCDSEAYPENLMEKCKYFYSEQGFSSLLADYKKYIDWQLSLLREKCFDALNVFNDYDLKKAISFTQNLMADIDAILGSDDIYLIKKYDNYSLRLDFERKLDEICAYNKDVVADCRSTFKKLIAEAGKSLTNKEKDLQKCAEQLEHTEWFLKVLRRFAQIYKQEKQEENILDFNDLEHFALQILSDEQIRKSVSKKYKYIFVDEYQDINAVQEQIIVSLENDNLFMVGDNKQSIYGFRGCRPEFFSRKFSSMRSSGQKVITLNHNFRSSGAVIDMVNRIFNYCMNEEFFGESYRKNSQLIAGAPWANNEWGRAQLHFLRNGNGRSDKAEKPRIYNLLEQLEQPDKDNTPKICSLVTDIINQELEKTYYDPKEEKHKQITYKDVVILTRSKNTKYVQDLVKGLRRHNISVNSEVEENICEYAEIQTLINALKIVDCFNQDMPLASTLKSPIGKFTNEDLFEIVRFYSHAESKKKDWGFLDAYNYYLSNADTLLGFRLKQFDEYISKVRILSDFLGAQGTLEKLISDSGYESFLLSQKQGDAKLERVRRFVAVTYASEKRLTVREFLYKVKSSPDSFSLVGGGQENAVRVMTIHASKGLEFPVVIVCGLERNMTDDEKEPILFSRKYGFAVLDFDDEKRTKSSTLLRGVIKNDMRVERMQEEMRLFYVATTRAMYSLHLTFENKKDIRKEKFDGAEHFLDYIPSSIPVTEHEIEDFDFIDLSLGTRKVLIGQTDEKTVQKIKDNVGFVYRYTQDTRLPLKASVTATLKVQADEQNFTHVLFDEPSPDIERGNVAHKILECLNFNQAEKFDQQIELMISGGILTKEQIDKVNLDRIKNAIVLSNLTDLKGYSLYREKSFIAGIPAKEVEQTDSEENIVVQGIIDLLAINDKQAKIFDYKYSSLDSESLKIKYQKQLKLYALAVEKVLGVSVTDKTLINLFTGDVVRLQ